MKIALVVTGGLHPSGRQQVMPLLLWLLTRLARAHEVHAFVLRHLEAPQSYELCGARVHDLGRPEGRWRQYRALAAALMAAGPFDVLHGFWADPAGLAAAMAGIRLRTPVVVTCDSGEFVSLPAIEYGLQRTARGRSVVAAACRFARAVHVTSEHMQQLAAAHGVSAVRIPMGPPVVGVDGGVERPPAPPWRLLQVASLNLVKDQSTLLRAAARVRQTLDVRLDLAGEDTLDGRLQREAAALGIADAVRFHGFVDHDALPALHRGAHLYVQSSLHEAAGVAVLEAAAAGLPIVGTRVGYVSDWNGRAAVAVPPGDADALAQAIVHVLSDESRRRALAHAARGRVEQHDADWTAQAMAELYASLSMGR